MAKDDTIRVPVKLHEREVGVAEISRDGEIINAELNSGMFPQWLRDAFLYGLADSISIHPNYIPALPETETQGAT